MLSIGKDTQLLISKVKDLIVSFYNRIGQLHQYSVCRIFEAFYGRQNLVKRHKIMAPGFKFETSSREPLLKGKAQHS